MLKEVVGGRAWWGTDPWLDGVEGRLWLGKKDRYGQWSEHWEAWDRDIGDWRPITKEEAESALREQLSSPVLLRFSAGRKYWLFKDRIYWTDPALDADEVRTLVEAKEVKKRRAIERARVVVNTATTNAGKLEPPGRLPISDDVKIFVWQRDGGACVRCDSRADLEFDHIIPLSMGGANTGRNLQLLCAPCNQSKGGNLV